MDQLDGDGSDFTAEEVRTAINAVRLAAEVPATGAMEVRLNSTAGLSLPPCP
ncbi:MAG: hypothetical protein ICV70_07120 [Jiangellaceae bacterium]|nr:hypothetical protein [Jiangellaceae bacterium]